MPQLPIWFRQPMVLVRSEHFVTLVVAAIIGVFTAYGAIIFRTMILGVEAVFWGTTDVTISHLESLPWQWKLLAPAMGALLLAPIVVRWAPEARGSGIPEVIESVAMHGGVVRRRVAVLKAVAASLCIGSGGSAGREGPIVHIGAAIGSWIAQGLRCSVSQVRTFVGCGVAGGIAATFNTPFAGALFAVEVVLGDFGAAKISPIVIASVVATVISRGYHGDFPHMNVPAFEENVTATTIWPYFLLGLICAFVSLLFINSLKLGWKLSGKWKFSPYLLPPLGGLMVGATGIFVPHVFGVGYDTINKIFSDEIGIALLAVVALMKIFATSCTLTTGGSGGVFAPSLFIGAAVGACFGALLQQVFPSLVVSPAAFALVGMGAVVAGTTRALISGVLIVFEMTQNHAVILPLLAACIPSMLVSSLLHRDSIYHAKLTMKGVVLKGRTELNLLKGLSVRDVMGQRVECLAPASPLTEVVDRFLQSPYPIMWLTDESGRLTGVLESQSLQIAMLERDSLFSLIVAQDIAVPVNVPIEATDDLSFAMKLFNDSRYEILPVVDRESGTLLGDLLRSDIIEAYNRELAMRDSLTTAADSINVADRLGRVDLGDGFALVEYEVPAHLTGKSIIELDLRRRIGIQAILIKRGTHRLVPGPETKLQIGDAILFAGAAEELESKLKQL